MTWEESRDFAKKKRGRLATVQEIRQIMNFNLTNQDEKEIERNFTSYQMNVLSTG